jgi:ketosteroid isomerase-like protein
MTEKENLGTVREAYRAFGSGDLDTLLGLLAEDVEWVTPRVEDVPHSGNCRGRTQVGEFFRALGEAEDVLSMTQDDFIVTGGLVATRGRIRSRVRATGRTVETPYAHFFSVVDGRIREFQEFYDTAAVGAAFRGAEEAGAEAS